MFTVSSKFFARTASACLLGGLLFGCGDQAAPTSTPQAGTGAFPVTSGNPTTALGAAGAAPGSSTSVGPVSSASAGSSSGQPAGSRPANMTTTTPTQGTAASGTWCGAKTTFGSRCVACHDGNKTAGAPMALKTYADLTAPAVSDPTKKVYEMVSKRIHDTMKPMPPQQKLAAAELSSIDDWIAAGATAGADPTCAGASTEPATPTDQAWPTNCDAMYKILSHGTGSDTTPYSVPAGQEIHPSISIPAPWGSDAVQMIAWRAITQNAKVLHHWILYGPSREFLVGWAPGKDANAPLPDDVGMNMPGGTLTLGLHYNNLTGTTNETDNSGFELCVVKKEHFRTKTATVFQGFSQFVINIPAHAMNYDVTGTCSVTTTQPVTLISASPHAHKTARHMKFTVQRASGETVVMHDRDFDFNEQGTYGLTPPVALNNGDKVITTCTYSNDSNSTITFGENTGNEMCFNFAVYYPMGALNCSGGFTPVGNIPGF
jgi:hypothetical protein